jgi:hypothetical protein
MARRVIRKQPKKTHARPKGVKAAVAQRRKIKASEQREKRGGRGVPIQAGDTFLSISEKEQIELDRLLEVNEGITQLHPGGVLDRPKPFLERATSGLGDFLGGITAGATAGQPPQAPFSFGEMKPEVVAPQLPSAQRTAQRMKEEEIYMTQLGLHQGMAMESISIDTVNATEGLSIGLLLAAGYVYDPATGLYKLPGTFGDGTSDGTDGGALTGGRRGRGRGGRSKPGRVVNPYARGGYSSAPAYSINWRANFAR